MHTAYDRKDNSEPASITALAVSKDHRTLYVGMLKITKILIFSPRNHQKFFYIR